ncbi:GNAT family N-acetyltransferase [Arachidicoccus terrestris]|uniref:GNAT family N-acetyltransferase n=1 Tax=Arachidicoccus terrestris TaxID=2875539 RepID=UPI001CC60132|nr:GNAT family N-acetyltransferase [Arachidicoccus terrestris]UAY57054.1 GNAT family N-acetyltransferase [Arachidicoccus terrestris]
MSFPTISSLPSIEFSLAQSSEQYDQGRILFREYAASLGFGLEFQDFEGELAGIEKKYGLPGGALILCREISEAQYIGCVAIRQLDKRTAELKRLYVRPDFRRLKLGRHLLEGAFQQARYLGYERIRLDTLPTFQAALQLYIQYGFYKIPAYYSNPMEGVVYMEKSL